MNNIESMISQVMSDPEKMKKVMDMAGTLFGADAAGEGGSAAAPAQPSAAPRAQPGGFSLDSLLGGLGSLPGGLKKAVGSFLGSASGGGGEYRDKTQLLESMKPWLSDKRRGKLDRVMKLARVMRSAGGAFLNMGDDS